MREWTLRREMRGGDDATAPPQRSALVINAGSMDGTTRATCMFSSTTGQLETRNRSTVRYACSRVYHPLMRRPRRDSSQWRAWRTTPLTTTLYPRPPVFSPDEGGVKASQLTREAWMNPNAGQDWKYASITRSWARTASHETKSFSESSLILSNFGLNFC